MLGGDGEAVPRPEGAFGSRATVQKDRLVVVQHIRVVHAEQGLDLGLFHIDVELPLDEPDVRDIHLTVFVVPFEAVEFHVGRLDGVLLGGLWIVPGTVKPVVS